MFGAKLSWCQIVRCQIVLVPNCPGAKLSVFIILVPNCPLYYLGAKLSGAKLSYNPQNSRYTIQAPGSYSVEKNSHLFSVLAMLAFVHELIYCTYLLWLASLVQIVRPPILSHFSDRPHSTTRFSTIKKIIYFLQRYTTIFLKEISNEGISVENLEEP